MMDIQLTARPTLDNDDNNHHIASSSSNNNGIVDNFSQKPRRPLAVTKRLLRETNNETFSLVYSRKHTPGECKSYMMMQTMSALIGSAARLGSY